MKVPSERLFMRLMKGSLVGLVLAGILAIAPTPAFARGGGLTPDGGEPTGEMLTNRWSSVLFPQRVKRLASTYSMLFAAIGLPARRFVRNGSTVLA